MSKNMKDERIGEIGYNNFGSKMIIIEYNSNVDMTVEFQDKHKAKVKTTWQSFKRGKVANPYDKTLCGVGYLGENHKINQDIYKEWTQMIIRCYDPYFLNRHPTYIDCYVCDDWLNFSNFSKWYEENYYKISNEKMCLDKDIKYKGNRIYSAENCLIVPERINTLFITNHSQRGSEPVGVLYRNGEYIARCNTLEGKIWIGSYSNPKTAFQSYKNFKEQYIKQVADEYRHLIPKKLYDAMYRYEIEITD